MDCVFPVLENDANGAQLELALGVSEILDLGESSTQWVHSTVPYVSSHLTSHPHRQFVLIWGIRKETMLELLLSGPDQLQIVFLFRRSLGRCSGFWKAGVCKPEQASELLGGLTAAQVTGPAPRAFVLARLERAQEFVLLTS